jgi:hypothetical protein
MKAYREAGEHGRLNEMKKISSALVYQDLETFIEGKTIELGGLHPVSRTATELLLCRQEFEREGGRADVRYAVQRGRVENLRAKVGGRWFSVVPTDRG